MLPGRIQNNTCFFYAAWMHTKSHMFLLCCLDAYKITHVSSMLPAVYVKSSFTTEMCSQNTLNYMLKYQAEPKCLCCLHQLTVPFAVYLSNSQFNVYSVDAMTLFVIYISSFVFMNCFQTCVQLPEVTGKKYMQCKVHCCRAECTSSHLFESDRTTL